MKLLDKTICIPVTFFFTLPLPTHGLYPYESEFNASHPTNFYRRCPLTSLVEMIYNATLDEYVYRKIVEGRNERFWWKPEVDASNIEDFRNDERFFTPNVSAGLYRMCGCNPKDYGNYTAKNVGNWDKFNSLRFNRPSQNNTKIMDENVEGSLVDMDQDEFDERDPVMICPLESNSCIMSWNVTENRITTNCYSISPQTSLVRNMFPLMCLGYSFLVLALFVSVVGRQTSHFVIRKIGGLCSKLFCLGRCCFRSPGDLLVDENSDERTTGSFDFELRYNQFLVERMLRQESRLRDHQRQEFYRILQERMLAAEPGLQQRGTRLEAPLTFFQRRSGNSNLTEDEMMESGTVVLEFADRGTTIARASRRQELALRTKTYKPQRNESHQDNLRAKISLNTVDTELSPNDFVNENGAEDPEATRRADLVVPEQINCNDGPIETKPNTNCDNEEEETCIICFGTLKEGEKVGDLPHCEHIFHASCLKTWIAQKNTCPMCLKPMATNKSSSY